MIRLIVNADDFGLCPGVNYGIIDSHLHGIVTSTTIMMNTPGTDHAIALSRQYSSLRVGIHLVLTCGRPLSGNVPSLVNNKGEFHSLSYLMKNHHVDLMELEKEWCAQIDALINAGLSPSHLDSHHHVHTWEAFLPVVQRIASVYNLPVRTNGKVPLQGVKPFSTLCLMDFYGDNVYAGYFKDLPDRVEDGMTVEVMTHPAYMDTYLLNQSSYNLQRLKELDILKGTVLPSEVILVK